MNALVADIIKAILGATARHRRGLSGQEPEVALCQDAGDFGLDVLGREVRFPRLIHCHRSVQGTDGIPAKAPPRRVT